MEGIQAAYRLRVLFEQKITAEYYDSFKGRFGRVQVEVLSYLYDHHNVRIQELADTLNISKQHASKIIARLEDQELVTKNADPQDGRSSLFCLSDSGMQLMEEHLALSNQLFEQRLRKLPHQDQQAMLSAMEFTASILERL